MQSYECAELAFGIGREEQLDSAVAAIARMPSRNFLDLSNKLGIEIQTGSAKWHQRNRCGTVRRRREHAGSSPGGLAARVILFEERNAKTLLRKAQGDGRADQAGANDDGIMRGHVSSLSRQPGLANADQRQRESRMI